MAIALQSNSFWQATCWQSVGNQVAIGWLLATYQLSASHGLTMGWLWAGYWQAIVHPSIHRLAIESLSVIYQLGIGWPWDDYGLAIRWLAAVYLWAGYWLAINYHYWMAISQLSDGYQLANSGYAPKSIHFKT